MLPNGVSNLLRHPKQQGHCTAQGDPWSSSRRSRGLVAGGRSLCRLPLGRLRKPPGGSFRSGKSEIVLFCDGSENPWMLSLVVMAAAGTSATFRSCLSHSFSRPDDCSGRGRLYLASRERWHSPSCHLAALILLLAVIVTSAILGDELWSLTTVLRRIFVLVMGPHLTATWFACGGYRQKGRVKMFC